jgi:phosphatidate cytidylyltransferase
MLSFVYLIRDMKHGLVLVLLIFVSSWINDTCAYFVGRALGKHKMAPVLSPKKSVEGLIGGIVGAGVFGGIYGLLFNSFVESISYAPLIFALVGALGAIPAVIGDLAASAIKRNNDIKDYGKLIPGHGGILDRFDSIIFTAPIIYYLLTFLL